ncbi:MAG: hypothetical protein H8E62_04995 [Planctomycetes bacterium]|nr:hypothetical protein [Planctomycetota bacterium]
MSKFKDYHLTLKLSVFFLVFPIAVFFFRGSLFPWFGRLRILILMASLPLSILFAISFIILRYLRPSYKGLTVASVSIFLSMVIMLMAFCAGNRLKNEVHIPHGVQMQCQENMKQAYKAFLAYAEDNNGLLPMSENWCDVLIEKKYIKSQKLVCPAVQKESEKSSYIFNASVAEKKLDDIPSETFLLYENASCGWNQTATTINITGTNHKIARRGFVNILYMNGKVQSVPEEDIGNFAKEK